MLSSYGFLCRPNAKTGNGSGGRPKPDKRAGIGTDHICRFRKCPRKRREGQLQEGGGGSVWNRLIGEVTERSNRVSDPARWEEKRGHSGSRARFGMGGRYFVKVGLWFFSRAFAPRRRGGRFFFSFLA